MNIAFYCPDRHIVYDGSTPDAVGVGGGITSRIRISAALAELGHDVQLIGNCRETRVWNRVLFRPLDEVNEIDTDLLVAHSSGGNYDFSPFARLSSRARARILVLSGSGQPANWQSVEPDALFFPSNFVRREVCLSWPVRPARFFVSPRGVCPESDRFPPLTEPPARNLRALIYASHPSKGLAPAMRVLDLLRAEDAAFSLDVFGGHALWGGTDIPVTAPGVTWHGLTPQNRLRQAYPAFGFAMHLQRRLEPFGVSLIESMHAGCVAIASPAGAYAEIVRHGENGFLVEGDPELPDTQQRAARLILNLCGNPASLARIRDQARRSPVSWLDIGRSWMRYAEPLVEGLVDGLTDGSICAECGGVQFSAPDGQHCVACGNYHPDASV
jgi:glycosyltransferase involved in cell wall biosynthesis